MPERSHLRQGYGGQAISGVTPAVAALLAAVRRRLAAIVALEAVSTGVVLGTAIVVMAWAFQARVAWTSIVAGLAGAAIAAVMMIRGWQRFTPTTIAAAIERRHPGLENLLVTTVELDQRGRPVHPPIVGELNRQTDARVQSVVPALVVPLARAATLTMIVALGAVLAWWGVGNRTLVQQESPASAVAPGAGAGDFTQPTITVVVTPPAYTSLPSTTSRVTGDSDRVEVLEGSRVRIEVVPAASDMQLIAPGQAPLAFRQERDLRWLELTAERTQFLLIRSIGAAATLNRMLAVLVKPDAAPIVRIRQPARDLVFAEPRGRVAVDIEATDDLALAALSLRYTRVFGSGESMTFQEGDIPLHIERVDRGQWRATSQISLDALHLEDGDTLVYRAMTRDLRPGRDPVSSETYLLEIGKLAEVASAGFALPDDKDRQAISQQMVIVKTERLLAARDRLSGEEFAEQARLLAVEQRMVRAEFVFMTGGEVEDEVAEAEHSHDLAEGRFENEGQVELLTAIREMSRAESRLNDAAVEPALTFERAALKALQRAFDRRRYLLRTTPERARIDQARRLTGTLADARSWRRQRTPAEDRRDLEGLEALVRDLAAAKPSAGDLGPLAARLGSVDPANPEVQKTALRLSSTGGSAPERAAAIDDALQLLADRGRKALSPTRAWVPHDPAAGRYADALARESRKP